MLYIVATPIGNLKDITLRALEVLKNVDLIACEDTRHTGLLLSRIGLKNKKLISYHDFNEEEKTKYLINELLSGKIVALVSDAGTPCISDPGYRIVTAAIENKIKLFPLPGATAFVPALIASGAPVHNFVYLGFPPQKKGRRTFIQKACDLEFTTIFYESPHRINKLVDEIIEFAGSDRLICISREISKIYEEFIRDSAGNCKKIIESRSALKGEIVLVMYGKPD